MAAKVELAYEGGGAAASAPPSGAVGSPANVLAHVPAADGTVRALGEFAIIPEEVCLIGSVSVEGQLRRLPTLEDASCLFVALG